VVSVEEKHKARRMKIIALVPLTHEKLTILTTHTAGSMGKTEVAVNTQGGGVQMEGIDCRHETGKIDMGAHLLSRSKVRNNS